MAIIGGYVSRASLYLEGSAMTMIDPDPYEWPMSEPKHRADVEPAEPAPVQHRGHCVTCDVCGEYVTG